MQSGSHLGYGLTMGKKARFEVGGLYTMVDPELYPSLPHTVTVLGTLETERRMALSGAQNCQVLLPDCTVITWYMYSHDWRRVL